MQEMITTEEIEIAVARLFNTRQNVIVPNICWGIGIHECDVFILRRQSGYAVEVEIKRTIADLKNDFKKKHNHSDRQNRIKEFYYAIPEELLEKAKPIIEKEAQHAGIITCAYNEKIDWQPCRAEYFKYAFTNKSAEKLSNYDQNHIAVLGTMRIWNLKHKLSKLNRKCKKLQAELKETKRQQKLF